MTCERCKDIHQAQRDGRTQRECGCSCHDRVFSGSTFTTNTGSTNNLNFWTDSGGASSALDLGGNEVF